MAEKCAKCGSLWFSGPKYDSAREVLVYRCSCGHRWTRPTKDAHKSIRSTYKVGGTDG